MVRDLNLTKRALGNGDKKIHDREREAVRKMGKMLVYSRDLPSGDVVTSEDFELKSPRDGVSPQELNDLLGTRLNRDVKQGQAVNKSDFGISGDDV